jgi:hypothetical protein
MDTKKEDYKLKPQSKFYKQYFSPNFNSHEMNCAVNNFLINENKVYKNNLIVININIKFLFTLSIKNNTTEITKIIIIDINDYLK